MREAIEALYSAFAGYSRPATFAACGCCWSGHQVAGAQWRDTDRPGVMVQAPGGDRPLRDLSADELEIVATDVPLTGGDLTILKHYLPRLLELAVEADPDDWPDLTLVLSRLTDEPDVGGQPWWEWPPQEKTAVQAFLHSLWLDRRREGPELAGDALCAIAGAVADIRPILEAWEADADPRATSAREAVKANDDYLWYLVKENGMNTMYEPLKSNRARVLAWRRSV